MDRPRFQVLVLDPKLIPYLVDVVIGDFIYAMHFKVEPETMLDNVELLSMEEMEDKGGEGEGKEDSQEANSMQIDEGRGSMVVIAVVLQKILRITLRRMGLSACFFSFMRLI
jgi:hypothetical protein